MASFPFPAGRRRAVAAGLVGLLLLALLLRHVLAGGGAGAGALQVAPLAGDAAAGAVVAAAGGTAAGAGAAGGARLVVDVVGAVRRPGVYRLRRGARVEDAVARAGGLTRRADPVAVNLAALLVDGEQVIVATRGSAGGAAASAPGEPLSLSTATAEQLDALPGIGPVTAQKIVDFRQQHGGFSSVDDLDAIPGIGPARLANLHGLVVP
jgi:competence protein ComEA